jgi:uncharacterized repeat protein (TIGR03803 family)
MLDGAGNFYGTTQLGGANNSGTVFELSPNGIGGYNEIVLYSFCSLPNCTDGNNPISNVIFDDIGNLYGTTCSGGTIGQVVASACSDGSYGYGVVFELSPEPGSGCPTGSNSGNGWCETVLYSFTSNPDGANPNSGLTWDSQGNLYGTTYGGGSGNGAVYELSPNSTGGWNEFVAYSFCSQSNCPDGAYPNGLVQATNGNFYGTTENGGAYPAGTVFELSPQPASGCPGGSYTGNGWCETIAYAFGGHPIDGSYPSGTPMLDNTGNVYGTTGHGGIGTCNSDGGCGTVWELTPVAAGGYAEEILHTFHSGPETLQCCYPIRIPHYPLAGLALDSLGNLYGTTTYGGNTSYCIENGGGAYEGCGTLFELARLPGKKVAYKFKLLWVFNSENGANPATSLIVDGGNLYGTTYKGGPDNLCPYSDGCGVAFEISP